jgi:hypothetical protein
MKGGDKGLKNVGLIGIGLQDKLQRYPLFIYSLRRKNEENINDCVMYGNSADALCCRIRC